MSTTSATTDTTPTPTADTRRPSAPAILRVEVRDELLGILREPTALFFSVLMPVLFYALFAALFGGEQTTNLGVPIGTGMLATFGAYAVIVSAMLTPGIGLAEAREQGWLRVLRVSPVPVPVTLAAKVAATVPYSVAILTSMTATAAALGILEITGTQWVALTTILVLGSLPFALVGLAVGAQATGNASVAILNAILFPTAIASGLWFPLESLPAWVGQVAVWLPPYHLAELALMALGKTTTAWPHVAALLGFTAIGAAVATVAYRRSPT